MKKRIWAVVLIVCMVVSLVPSTGVAAAPKETESSSRRASSKVTDKTPKISVTKISLNKTAATLLTGKTITLKATIKPRNATNKTIIWKSSNTKVATVSTKGVVTAKGAGKATITATVDGKSKTCKITVQPVKPPGVKAVSASYNSIKVSWNRVTGASGYEIHRAAGKNGKYSKIGTVTKGTSVTYTNKNAVTGTAYYYKIRAYTKSGQSKIYSGYSGIVSAKATLTAPVATVKKASSTSVKVSWKQISGADGYQVQMSGKKTSGFSNKATVKKGKTVSATVKELKKDKTYYFRVRAYRTVNGKNVYSGWSAVKSIDMVSQDSNSPVSKKAYILPSNVTFNDCNVTYDGKEHHIVADHIPTGIIASYSNAARTDAGVQTAKVVFSLDKSLAETYSGVEPGTMTAVLTINPANPSYTVPVGLTAEEGQTLGDIADQLGSGFSFEKPLSTPVGDPGTHEFTVTYNPGSANYNIVRGIKVTVSVSEARMTYFLPSNVGFSDVEENYSAGTVFTAEVTNLPDHIVAIHYINNTRTDVGEQTARAEFSIKPEWADLYDSVYPGYMEAKIRIYRGIPSYTVPTGLTAYVNQTLADVAGQLGEGFEFEDPLDTSVGRSAGDNLFNVKYTPSDLQKYKIITGISVTITVSYPDDGPDKSELNKAIENAEAEKANRSAYTEEIYLAFLKAYEEAMQMPETTQDEVDGKTDTITAAIRLLKLPTS